MRPISNISNEITSATAVRDTDAMMRLAEVDIKGKGLMVTYWLEEA